MSRTLPRKTEKTNKVNQIVAGIMVSAGDCMPPNPQSVKKMTAYIHGLIRTESELSSVNLKEKYNKLCKKLKNAKQAEKNESLEDEFAESDEEFDETNKDENMNFERLEFNDIRTQSMSVQEYQKFSSCRKSNFTNLGKEKFAKWSNSNHSYELLAQIAWNQIYTITETAIKNRDEAGKLKIQNTPLQPEELAV